MKHPGYFISFEGLDGSGKTSIIYKLEDHLFRNGLSREKLLLIREPGGTLIGDQIRTILHDHVNSSMTPETELLLFMASRAQIVREIILPHLENGGVVISDRYADSTLAYQGYGRKLGLQRVMELNDFATKELAPDMTIYLDISPEEGILRRQRGAQLGEEFTRLDAEEIEFHRMVQEGYRYLIESDIANRWVVVNGDQPPENVLFDCVRLVDSRLREKGLLEGSTVGPDRRG